MQTSKYSNRSESQTWKGRGRCCVDKEMYQCLVGRLIYLSHTQLDIAYALSIINQFMQSPKEVHLQAAYRVLQYLNGTPGKGILFKRNGDLVLEAYTDVDYA